MRVLNVVLGKVRSPVSLTHSHCIALQAPASSSSWQTKTVPHPSPGSWMRQPSKGTLKNQEQQKQGQQQQQRGQQGKGHVQDASQMRRDLGRAEKKIASLKAENARLEAELYKRDAQSQRGQLLYVQQQHKARMCSVAKSCHVASFLVLVLPGEAGGGARSCS